jgi:hypothetical protein
VEFFKNIPQADGGTIVVFMSKYFGITIPYLTYIYDEAEATTLAINIYILYMQIKVEFTLWDRITA